MSNLRAGTDDQRRSWLAIRRWRRALMLGGVIYWSAYAVAALLFGGGSFPLPDEDEARSRYSGTWTAFLVISRTRGMPRMRQIDLDSRALVRIGGPAVLVRGSAWVQQDVLVWMPAKRWRQIGAKGFSLPIHELNEVSVTRLSRKRVGVVVGGGDGWEAWLLFRDRYAELMNAFARQLPQTGTSEKDGA